MQLIKAKLLILICLLSTACTDKPTEKPANAMKQPILQEHPAVTATKKHYRAITDKNCAAATQFRPGYLVARCQRIDNLQLKRVELKAQAEQAAAVGINISYQIKNNEPTSFSGLVLVKNVGGQWLLQEDIESYYKLNDTTPEAFLAKYTSPPPPPKPKPSPAPNNDTRFLMGKFDPATLPNLVTIESRYASRNGMKMDNAAYADFKKMHQAAKKAGINLVIKSATRNFGYQKGIWEGKWTGQRPVNGENLPKAIKDSTQRALKILQYSAMPGSSRHHWGTDIDLNAFENSYFESGAGKKVYEWLRSNAANYGFCQPYTKKGTGRNTGYNEEKWHWSYKKRSQTYTQKARQLLKNNMFKDFKGAETADAVNITGNYILGIDKQCLD